MSRYDPRGSGPQRISNSRLSRWLLLLLFVGVAGGTVTVGMYLSRYAPREDELAAGRGPVRHAASVNRAGKDAANTPLSSLQKSVLALKQHQKDLEELMPDSDPKRSQNDPDPTKDLFSGNKSLGDYTKMLMDAVKSMSSFSEEVSK